MTPPSGWGPLWSLLPGRITLSHASDKALIKDPSSQNVNVYHSRVCSSAQVCISSQQWWLVDFCCITKQTCITTAYLNKGKSPSFVCVELNENSTQPRSLSLYFSLCVVCVGVSMIMQTLLIRFCSNLVEGYGPRHNEGCIQESFSLFFNITRILYISKVVNQPLLRYGLPECCNQSVK